MSLLHSELGKKLNFFFDQHYQELILNYPGINLKRLVQEFDDYFEKNEESLLKFIQGLKEGVPLAYISSKCFFYESVFIIDRNCLIPRFETEVLVELALEEIKKQKIESVLDIGVGPGTILLSILKSSEKRLNAVGVDISSNALDIAQKNYFQLKNEFKFQHIVQFLISDRVNNVDKKFDLIVSNPPYIKMSDRQSIHPQVLKFEPHLALFLDDSNYQNWFLELFQGIQKRLNSDGLFLMEGHEDYLEELKKLASFYFQELELINDLTGRKRILKARFLK